MSGVLGPLAVVPVSSAPQADLPDYVEPARAFFGDDAAVEAYLTQLEGYAADGAEATDLLDAAEAAGTVSEAIAILAGGGGPSLGTYADLREVLDEIAGGGLVEGQAWRIAWTGDLYLPDGEALGVVRRGKPAWRGVIPSPLLGVAWTVISGGVTYDGDGRPILTTTGGAAGTTQSIEMDCDLGPFLALVAHTQYQATGTPSLTGTAGPAARFGLAAMPTTRVLSTLAYVGSEWFGVGAGFGGPFAALSPALNPSTARELIFEIDILANRRDALPRGFTRIAHSGNAFQNFDSATPISGDWSDWNSDLDARLRLENTDLGVASTLTLTGLECAHSS